jgi:hypothetical protein
MSQKSLLELRIGGLSGHFLQRLHRLLLGVIDVAQLMRGQVVHGLDVFGKESLCQDPLFWGTRKAALPRARAAAMSDLPVRRANLRIAMAFLANLKTL